MRRKECILVPRRESEERREQIAEPQKPKMFITITETAEITGLAETFLRKLHDEGKLPGVQCGRRFMVNSELFLQHLKEASQGSMEC